MERTARAGYAARGVVYALVGLLAVQAAAGGRRHPTDTRGALQAVAGQSTALLWLIGAGLSPTRSGGSFRGSSTASARGTASKGSPSGPAGWAPV